MSRINYQQLCVKEITGNITETEKMVLMNWLAESGENRAEFEKIKTVWDNTSPGNMPEMPDIDIEWDTLYRKIQSLKVTRNQNIFDRIYSFVRSIKLKPALVYGFAVILIASVIFILKENNNLAPALTQIETVDTANKEQKTIQLSDGSVVTLNHNSKITFPEKFNKKTREVNLTGEAFFSIKKGTIPFVVVTANAKTTVLGTKFNVWARDGETEVYVKEGHVKLAQKTTIAKGVDLLKGQLSKVIRNNLPTAPKKINADYLSGWTQGRLIFNQTPLRDVINELERYYNIKLSVKNETLLNQTITGSFKNDDIDSVLSMICLTMDLNYEKNNEGYSIQ